MALLAAFSVERSFTLAKQTWPHPLHPVAWRLVAITSLALILAYPGYNAWQARDKAQPYLVQPQVQQALDWLAASPPVHRGEPAKVYSVGLWNWHSFLVPSLADRPLIDGWHDEGAPNVKLIRRLRQMAWFRGESIDTAVVHQILTTLGAKYVLLHLSYWSGERTGEFWDQFEQHSDLFVLRERWGDVGIFEVLAPEAGLALQPKGNPEGSIPP